MRVHIGKYPDWIRGKKNKKRKVEITIEKFDTWSMDHTLALIIHPMLKQLKKTNHGAPDTDDEDVPKKLRSTSAPKKKNEWDIDKNHFKRWDWIMDEMIWAFGTVVKDDEEKTFRSGKADILWQALDKDNKPIGKPQKLDEREKDIPGAKSWSMIKGPNDTYKIDHKGLEKFYERQKNAFRLFGKYFRNLWD